MKVRHCVIVCDTAAHTGGVSAVVLAQARGLHARGIAVSVFAHHGPVDPALAGVCQAVHCIHPLAPVRQHLSEIWSREALHALALFLVPFDTTHTLVHIHAVSMGLSPSVAVALRNKGMRFIITAHDASWACPTGTFYNFQQSTYCHLQPMSLSCLASACDQRTRVHKAYKVVKAVALDHVSHLKRDAAAVLVPSALLAERLRPRMPADTPLITLLNPVAAVQRPDRKLPGAAFLFVGRLWEEKGLLQWLQAVGSRYPLVVVGEGPLREVLAARYPEVVFAGWLSATEVARHMRRAIALVLPSVSLEAFGLVVPEALSQGVPVIVSDRAGSSAMVRPGINGFVVDMGQPEQIQRACEKLMNAPRAAAMSASARTLYWDQPLSTDLYIDSLLRVFDAIGPAALQHGERHAP